MTSNDDSQDPVGGRRFLGVPYDLRRPTVARVRQRRWNSEDPRVIVPKAFGVGWTVNWGAVGRRLRPKR